MSTLNRLSTLATASPDACDLAWGCCRPDESRDGLSGTCRLPADAPPIDSKGWFRLALGLFVAAQTMLFGLSINLTPPEEPAIRLALQWAMLLATLVVFGLLGLPMLGDALRQLRERRVTMEMFFVVGIVASISLSGYSMAIGHGPVYFEVAATLLIVYTLGRAISGQSRRQAMTAIGHWVASLSLARLVSDENPKGKIVPVSEIRIGDCVQVLPGELIPVDGRIEQGQAFISETAFTGQWLAARKGPGDRVIAATANQDGVLQVRAESDGAARQMDHLAEVIRQAQRQPSQLQKTADRFVAWFLPLVLLASLGTFGYWTMAQSIHQGIHAALAVLMIACPCAAGLAAPLAVWNVMGRLAGQGMIVRHGDAIEQLAQADSAIFDKTGTLGSEQLVLKKVERLSLPEGLSENDVLAMVAAIESMSTHPVAKALQGLAVDVSPSAIPVGDMTILAGQGVAASVTIHDKTHHLMLVRDDSASQDGASDHLTILALLDDRPVIRFGLQETLRSSAESAVAQLKAMGLAVTIMTGDGSGAQAKVAHLATATTGMTPEQKHQAVIALRQGDRAFSRPIFVGDGLNDAAAMAASHSSLAMGHGSAVAIDSASMILVNNDLTRLPQAISLARSAMRVARSNLAWAVAYNLIGIAAAATGHLHPILASLLMSASSLWVSWRSFHAADFQTPVPVATSPTSQAKPLAKVSPYVKLFTILHWIGWLGQGLVLAMILGGSITAIVASLAAFSLISWLTLRWWPKYPHWADMTLAMLTLGGLGMNFGWWADLGFAPIPACHSCCVKANGNVDLLTWMNAGMLLLGVPAMFLIRYRPEPFRWNRWCCTGMLVLGVPGMVAGMLAGSALTRLWFSSWPNTANTLIHFVLMTVGMVVGMLIPHFLEYALPRRWRSDDSAR